MDQRNELGQFCGVGFREDAMAKVEDVTGQIASLVQSGMSRLFDDRPRGEHECRVQVALDGNPFREPRSHLCQAGAPVDADYLAAAVPDVLE